MSTSSDGPDGSRALWGSGIVLMVIGTFASAIGMLCLKRASISGVPWYANGWFWCGICLFVIVAALLDVVVFALTPLALIAPFSGLTIVASFVLSYVGCLGVREVPTRTTAIAVLIITAGVTLSAIFGPKDHGSVSPEKLAQTYRSQPWLLVLSILGGVSFLIFVPVTSYHRERFKPVLSSWAGALVLAMLAAFFGTLTQLQFKAVASAVFTVFSALGGDRPVPKVYSSAGELLLQLFSVACSAVGQIGFLNYGISVAPVAYSVPAYQASLIVLTLIFSGWVLNEYEALPFINEFFFWFGAAVVISGMLLNAWGLSRQADARKREAEATLGEEPLSDPDTHRKWAPWENEYPGADGDPDLAEKARRAAAMRFS